VVSFSLQPSGIRRLVWDSNVFVVLLTFSLVGPVYFPHTIVPKKSGPPTSLIVLANAAGLYNDATVVSIKHRCLIGTKIKGEPRDRLLIRGRIRGNRDQKNNAFRYERDYSPST